MVLITAEAGLEEAIVLVVYIGRRVASLLPVFKEAKPANCSAALALASSTVIGFLSSGA